MALGPAPPPGGSELDAGMDGDGDLGALLDRGGPEVAHEHLDDADVAHHHDQAHLLLHVDDGRLEPVDEVLVALPPREAGAEGVPAPAWRNHSGAISAISSSS